MPGPARSSADKGQNGLRPRPERLDRQNRYGAWFLLTREWEYSGFRMENREETNEKQDFRRDVTSRNVLKSQHDSPSPEGSLIRLLAGLLTLVSSGWPPSQSLNGSVVCFGQPSTITVAGPSRILTGFPIKFQKNTRSNNEELLLPADNEVKHQAHLPAQLWCVLLPCRSRSSTISVSVRSDASLRRQTRLLSPTFGSRGRDDDEIRGGPPSSRQRRQ